MKWTMCFFLFFLLQEGHTQAESELDKQFLSLENAWMNAWLNNDRATAAKILADEFTLTSSLSTGELMTKDQWLSALDKYKARSFHFDKVITRKYGKVVLVKSWYHQEAEVNGKPWNGSFLLTDLWVKKGKNWQVVSRHASWLDK